MNDAWAENIDDLTVLALGGNLPGDHGAVEAALNAALGRLAGVGLELVRCSRWWRSAAWPDPSDPPFLNGVALVRTRLKPLEALTVLHGIERDFGARGGPRNSPRVLDLDLIASGQTVLNTPELVLPHPRAAERSFVMGPLAEIAPAWRHPVLGLTAEQLALSAQVGRDARPISGGLDD
jgi:2-amino-4-hydroxy-6-hydroxymethyldihydropteridine diphosphokinase